MSTPIAPRHELDLGIDQPRRLTETKSAFKTTEFIFYVVSVVGVLIASAVIDASNAGNANADGFSAQQAWFLITLLTIGYMVSRGLAKSGSRDNA